MMISEISWPLSRLDEAMTQLVHQAKLVPDPQTLSVSFPEVANVAQIETWLHESASYLGVEVIETAVTYPHLSAFLESVGPSVCLLPQNESPRLLIILTQMGKACRLIGNDGKIYTVPVDQIRAALCDSLEAALEPEIDQLFSRAGGSARKMAKARTQILNERLAHQTIGGCWQITPQPSISFWHQIKLAKVPRLAFSFLAFHAIQYGLFLLSWWAMGQSVFAGDIQQNWLAIWAILILSLVPFRLEVTWLQGRIAVRIGKLLQKRLLFGSLKMHPDEIRHMGVGQLMGRVFESETVETLAVNGGLLGLMGLIELILSGLVFTALPSGWLFLLLLIGWIAILGTMALRYYERSMAWTHRRRILTHDLIEKMVGHRTRMVQMRPARWHQKEDQLLESYQVESVELDQLYARFTSLASHGWVVLSLFGLITLLLDSQNHGAHIALALGGILSAALALNRLSNSALLLLETAVSWEQIVPLFSAAARTENGAPPDPVLTENFQSDAPLLDIRGVQYQYPRSKTAVLQNCNLSVQKGDHFLIEGESGGGKSTLFAMLTGLRKFNKGSIQINGREFAHLNGGQRQKHIGAAPQFHENHVLGSTFLFNLVMAKQWPPTKEQYAEAWDICQELGLGELLAKMPAGMLQMVGEIGWQLSHGEKSRLYIARSLLQGADVLMLDESFAALDPENMQRVMSCVTKRANTLMVIAHP